MGKQYRVTLEVEITITADDIFKANDAARGVVNDAFTYENVNFDPRATRAMRSTRL